MSYYYLEVQFNRPEDLFDIAYAVGIHMTFVQALQGIIESHNFNKYWEKDSPRPPMIQFRVKTSRPDDVLQVTKRVCAELVSDRRIAGYSDQLLEWKEPEFVQQAHDLGTALALHFVSYILQNQSLSEQLKQKPDWFMAHFVASTLQKAGFDIPYVWAAMRNSPITDEQVADLTDATSRLLSEAIREKPTSSFMERLLHAFFNCTLQQVESQTIGIIFNFLAWKSLTDSWRGPEVASGPFLHQ